MPHRYYTRPPFKVIAHRGNSSQAPENTRAAFDQAIKFQVDFLECDVQMSKDNVPLIIHDSTFRRISNDHCPKEVNQLSLTEIKEFDAGSWFDEKYREERISTLEEFLQLPKEGIGVMIDIKKETIKESQLAKIVGNVIKNAPASGPVLIGSLNPAILICLEAYLPDQQLIPIVDHASKFKEFSFIHASHYALHYSLATKKRIHKLHELGCEVWAWTVDDKEMALHLMQQGIDGIITNMPKKMMAMHLAPG